MGGCSAEVHLIVQVLSVSCCCCCDGLDKVQNPCDSNEEAVPGHLMKLLAFPITTEANSPTGAVSSEFLRRGSCLPAVQRG